MRSFKRGRQGPPLHELHREVRTAVGLESQRVDGDDAGVLELAPDLGLLDEALEDLGVLPACVLAAGP